MLMLSRSSAMLVSECFGNRNVKSEKISDQKKIIDLQDKLLVKKDAELESVKAVLTTPTVKSEIQS